MTAPIVQTGPTVARWQPYEIVLAGPAEGNPYVDVTLRAEFRHRDRTVTAHGFHDGDGVYRVRVMPDAEGSWTYHTVSDTPALDGHTGECDCVPAGADDHGPVRVHERFHFRYADGTRYLGRLGVEADVILFHPYDRWGYAAMGADADDRYVRYLVARLAAFPTCGGRWRTSTT